MGRALVARPKFILLDEPSLGLAPLIVDAMFDAILAIRDREGIGFLVVEQNAEQALRVADFAHVMELGRIVTSGTPDAIAADPVVERGLIWADDGRRGIMLVLNHDCVLAALSMADCIEAVREALQGFARGSSQAFPRAQLRPRSRHAADGTDAGVRRRGSPRLVSEGRAVCPRQPWRKVSTAIKARSSCMMVRPAHCWRWSMRRRSPPCGPLPTSAIATLALAPPTIRKIAILGAGGRRHGRTSRQCA